MIDTIGIIIGYVLLAASLLWVMIGVKGHYILKMILTTVSIAVSLFIWFSIEDLRGWATNDSLPQAYEIKAIEVQEPGNGQDGKIIIMLKKLDQFKSTSGRSFRHPLYSLHGVDKKEPRLHRLPYSREAHEQAHRIQRLLRMGRRVFLRRKGPKGDGQKGKGSRRNKTIGQGDKGGDHGDGSDGNPLGYLFLPFDLPDKR